ncbi:unnamed protein product [Brassica oleracea var. botrytis]
MLDILVQMRFHPTAEHFPPLLGFDSILTGAIEPAVTVAVLSRPSAPLSFTRRSQGP